MPGTVGMNRMIRSVSKRYNRVSGPICCIGDIHGHTDKLKSLWDKIPKSLPNGEEDFEKLNILFLGDYCDKGPDTPGTLEFLSNLHMEFPKQKHFFLSGNHDFGLSSFLDILPKHDDDEKIADTWKTKYQSYVTEEELYSGEGYERMHLQGRRYAAINSVFESEPTFASYGVAYGDREGLLKAMPQHHKDFLSNLQWLVEIKSTVGDVVGVHAGLEDEKLETLEDTMRKLRNKDVSLLEEPFIEPLCGRANVERMPGAMHPPILRQRGYLPPPVFLVSGHHGFVRVNGRRAIVDMCSGRTDRELAALMLIREGSGSTHHHLSNDQGLQMKILTSKPATKKTK